MPLNNVQPEQRLAYLLGLNGKLTPGGKWQKAGKVPTAVTAAMLGAGVLVLLSLWVSRSPLTKASGRGATALASARHRWAWCGWGLRCRPYGSRAEYRTM
jgi:hypothetical protein